MQSKYSIKDLEHLSGIKAHTLRIWEQRYGIMSPQRTATNIRYYRDEDLKHILNVSVLVKNGFRISRVAEFSNDELHDKVLEMTSYKGSLESQINSLKVAMLDFDQELFEKVLNQAIFQMGTEKAFDQLVGAFIVEVGMLWQTNSITLSHEHFISNLIKQKLFSAIDQLVVSKRRNDDTYVLYLPADEMHELSLLYLYYFLRKEGKGVVFLGQSVPMEHLQEVLEASKARNIISIFTTRPYVEDMDHYFHKLNALYGDGDYTFHFTGSQVSGYKTDQNPGKFLFYDGIEQIRNAIAQKKRGINRAESA